MIELVAAEDYGYGAVKSMAYQRPKSRYEGQATPQNLMEGVMRQLSISSTQVEFRPESEDDEAFLSKYYSGPGPIQINRFDYDLYLAWRAEWEGE